MDKEKIRSRLSLALIGIATITIGLLSYALCYMCINLYNIGCKEEFAAVVIGVIFMGAISGLLYTISVTWKEVRENH